MRYDILGSVWLTTNLKVMVVRRRMKDSCSRLCGIVRSTENVANVRLQINSCQQIHIDSHADGIAASKKLVKITKENKKRLDMRRL